VDLDQLRALPPVKTVEFADGALRVGVSDLAAATPFVLQWLVDHGHRYRHAVTERADLETVFLSLTGRTLRDR